MRRPIAALLATPFILAACAGVPATDSTSSPPATPSQTATPNPTIPTQEYLLAERYGDLGSEAEFGYILDLLTEGVGACPPQESRNAAASMLLVLWLDNTRDLTLLDYARAFVRACEAIESGSPDQ